MLNMVPWGIIVRNGREEQIFTLFVQAWVTFVIGKF